MSNPDTEITQNDAEIAAKQAALLARADAFEIAGEPDKAQALRDEADALDSPTGDTPPQ